MKILIFIIWLILGIFYFYFSNNQQNKCCEDSKLDQATEQNVISQEDIDNTADSSAFTKEELMKVEAPKEKEEEYSYTIFFPYNSSGIELNQLIQDSLEVAKKIIETANQGKLLVTGHSDSIGSGEINQLVAMKRANFIADYLIRIGIDPSKLEVKSSGEDQPIADNSTLQGRDKNRRVEILYKP